MTNKDVKTLGLWTGQGSQVPLMGLSIAKRSPVFSHHWHSLHSLYQKISKKDILRVITQGTNELDQTLYTQPALVIFELAHAYTMQDIGCSIHAHVGHSIGELAAAIYAKVMSLEQGLWLLHHRARLMQSCPEGSGMMAMTCNEQTALLSIKSYPDIDIAGLNHGKQTIVSGPLLCLEVLKRECKLARCIPLNVSHGFHSRCMNSIVDEFHNYASQINYKLSQQPIYANVSGQVENHLDANYWSQQITAPVRFIDCIDAANRDFDYNYCELGPKPTLTSFAKRLKSEIKVSPAIIEEY